MSPRTEIADGADRRFFAAVQKCRYSQNGSIPSATWIRSSMHAVQACYWVGQVSLHETVPVPPVEFFVALLPADKGLSNVLASHFDLRVQLVAWCAARGSALIEECVRRGLHCLIGKGRCLAPAVYVNNVRQIVDAGTRLIAMTSTFGSILRYSRASGSSGVRRQSRATAVLVDEPNCCWAVGSTNSAWRTNCPRCHHRRYRHRRCHRRRLLLFLRSRKLIGFFQWKLVFWERLTPMIHRLMIFSRGCSAVPSTNCQPMMIASIRTLNRTKGISCIRYSKGDPRFPLH